MMNYCLFVFCIFISVDVCLSTNGVKLLEEYKKFLGKEDAFDSIFGLKLLSQLTDPVLRQNQYGFSPGLWGTEALPINFWFHNVRMSRLKELFLNNKTSENNLILELSSSYSWILSTNNSVLINMNWFQLTQLCDEIKFPRCSWKYFINIADPFEMDYSLLHPINPALTNVTLAEKESTYPDKYSENYIVPVILKDCYPIKSIDQMSAIYIYAVCFMYSKYLDMESMKICPDPCKDFPCRTILNADINSCRRFGIYKRNFECLCLQGYRWDPKGLACLAENYCFTICRKRGTRKCNFFTKLGTVECICKSGFMGFDCAVLNNACIFGESHPSRITGLEACNTAEGKNKCFPLLGTSSYSCGCSPPFVSDRNLPYDNCMAKTEQCANRLCVFGSCETSPDGYRSYCQCDLDFKGEECDVPRGQWSPWSNWTECFPDCGLSSISHRIRYCVGQIDDCIGQAEEIKKCDKKSCFYDRPPEEIVYDIFWWRCLITSLTSISYLVVLVLISSILTLFRSQKTRTEKVVAKKARRQKVKTTLQQLKKRYSRAPDAEHIIETLEDAWDPNADEEEMKTNLGVINNMLMKLKKNNPKVFEAVTERSEIAALALTYND